jgi:hypothetical protein
MQIMKTGNLRRQPGSVEMQSPVAAELTAGPGGRPALLETSDDICVRGKEAT